jgi:predicted secreted protein
MRSVGLIGLAFLVLSPPTLAAEPAQAEQNLRIRTDLTGKTKISLTQQARKSLPRDRVKISLRIEVQGDSSKVLQEQINKQMPKVLEIVGGNQAVWVESGSYRVYREPESNSHPERWHATQEIALYSGEFAEALLVAGKCQAIGLLMTDMAFMLAPETLTNVQSELTKTALDELRARADEVAADLGLRIENYQNISVGNASETYESARGSSAGSQGPAKSGTPVAQGGQASVGLSVSAEVVMVRK